MFDDLNRLELTAKDIELIEAALQTQKKILAVQSEAGGAGARQKLSDLKRLMKRVNRLGCAENTPKGGSWTQLVKSVFWSDGQCTQVR